MSSQFTTLYRTLQRSHSQFLKSQVLGAMEKTLQGFPNNISIGKNRGEASWDSTLEPLRYQNQRFLAQDAAGKNERKD